MMKKVLVLLTVLALASMASAVLQISVNSEKNPVDSEIFVDAPSGLLTLDIWTTARIAPTIEEVPGYQLVVEMADATISGGVNNYASEPGVVIYDDIVGAGFPAEPTANGVWGTILITGIIAEIPANATIFDGITLHCEGENYDTVVKLYTSADYFTWTLVDSVVIHQIPEPMTLALLGLGGLFLRKRS